MNEWSYISIPPTQFHGMDRDSFYCYTGPIIMVYQQCHVQVTVYKAVAPFRLYERCVMLHSNELGSQWEAKPCIKLDGITAKFRYP
jgi:hypothetical protein